MYNIHITYGHLNMSYIENMLPVGQPKQTDDAITFSQQVFVNFDTFAEKGDVQILWS